MSASSLHSHLSEPLCDLCIALPHTSNTSSSLPHHSCIQQHASGTDVDEHARHFKCNICLHLSHDPVVTMCGHLFCWPCLFPQLSLHSASKECPVCKADVQDRIIPLYGCGIKVRYATDSLADRIQIPCRPSVTRMITPFTCDNDIGRSETTRVSVQLGSSLPPLNTGFLCAYAHSAVSFLVRGRRFNNEKAFVLHWAFILMALVAIAILLAC